MVIILIVLRLNKQNNAEAGSDRQKEQPVWIL
jgi:hypothetical protein